MKTTLMRKKSAATVVAASQRWAAATTEKLAELLRLELAEGENLPDLELLQELLGRALARRGQRLEAADPPTHKVPPTSVTARSMLDSSERSRSFRVPPS